jgi:hypothetical protein
MKEQYRKTAVTWGNKRLPAYTRLVRSYLLTFTECLQGTIANVAMFVLMQRTVKTWDWNSSGGIVTRLQTRRSGVCISAAVRNDYMELKSNYDGGLVFGDITWVLSFVRIGRLIQSCVLSSG